MMLAALIMALGCGPETPDPHTLSSPAGAPFELGVRRCLSGQVSEVLAAGSYTYVAYQSPEGQASWLVTLSSSTLPEPGQNAHFVEVAREQNFHSARLQRDFSQLGFGFVGAC